MKKDLDYFMGLNYEVKIKGDDNGEFFTTVEDLPGCMTTAPSQEEALAAIEEAKLRWLKAALKSGVQINEPIRESKYSGKILVRTHPDLHRALVKEADEAGVSLNLYLNILIMQNRRIMTGKIEKPAKSGDKRSRKPAGNKPDPQFLIVK